MSENNDKILLLTKKQDGEEIEVIVPVNCRVFLISSRNNPKLRAVATVSFAGITISDIRIYENKAELSVIYPTRIVMRRGKETTSSVAFPNNGYTSNVLKHIIIKHYSEEMLKVGGHPYLRVLDKEVEKNIEKASENNDTDNDVA